MSEIPVTLVTANATHDDEWRNRGYTDEEAMYREIYTELRQNCSLDKFKELIGSEYSKAWWSKYERDVTPVTRQAKNELRRAVGMPELVPTVTEAMADTDPDAEVWRIGDNETVHRVVKIATHEELTLNLNGRVMVSPNLAQPVTTVTSSVEANCSESEPLKNNHRKTYWRPCLPLDLKERAEAAGLDVAKLVEEAVSVSTISRDLSALQPQLEAQS
jgi:hypothetical protein